jgi:hypothetical protein
MAGYFYCGVIEIDNANDLEFIENDKLKHASTSANPKGAAYPGG